MCCSRISFSESHYRQGPTGEVKNIPSSFFYSYPFVGAKGASKGPLYYRGRSWCWAAPGCVHWCLQAPRIVFLPCFPSSVSWHIVGSTPPSHLTHLYTALPPPSFRTEGAALIWDSFTLAFLWPYLHPEEASLRRGCLDYWWGLRGKLSLGHGGFQTRETLEPPGESLRMNLPEAPPQAQWIQMLKNSPGSVPKNFWMWFWKPENLSENTKLISFVT